MRFLFCLITVFAGALSAFPALASEINFLRSTYTVSEQGGEVIVRVQRTGDLSAPARATVLTQEGTATSDVDFFDSAQEFIWDSDSSEIFEFSIPVVNRPGSQPDRSFTVVAQNVEGASLGATGSATVVIRDVSSVSSFEIVRSAYSISERGGSITIGVQRTGEVQDEAGVTMATFDNTALAGRDYQNTATDLNWEAGERTILGVTIPIIDRAGVNGDRSFTVRLSGPTGGVIGTTGQSTVTIQDASVAPQDSSVALLTGSVFVNRVEGDVTLQVARDGALDNPASVDFETRRESAAPGIDYQDSAGRLNWPAGDGSPKSITIPVFAREGGPEQARFFVGLSNPIGTTLGGTTQTGVTILTEVAGGSPGQIEFRQPTFVASEGANFMEVVLERTGGSTGEVSADVATTVDGSDTASAGDDYEPVFARLTWPNGVAGSRSFSVPLNNDDEVEDDELFSLRIVRTGGGAAVSGEDVARGLIVDDDVRAPGSFEFALGDRTVREDSGVVSLRVVRRGGSDGEVNVRVVTIDDSARAGVDYESVDTTLNFSNGDVDTQTISVPLIDDDLVNPGRSFRVRIASVDNEATVGNGREVRISIANEDFPEQGGRAEFNSQELRVEADDAIARIPVERMQGSDGELVSRYRILEGTAKQGVQFEANLDGELRWENGEAGVRFINITLLQPTPNDGRNKTLRIILLDDGDDSPPPSGDDGADNGSAEEVPFEDDSAEQRALTTKDTGGREMLVTIAPPREGDNSLSGSFSLSSILLLLLSGLIAIRRRLW